MPTPRREIITDSFYHLYNRGNHRDAIFHRAADYVRFLWMLADAAAECGVDVAAYCLMPNHYHVLVRPREDGALERMMRSFTVSYAMYFNRSYGQVGQLFQGRYQMRTITSQADLVGVSRYIHQNPRAFAAVESYEWSSYRAYLGGLDRFCDPRPVLAVLRELYGVDYETFCRDVKSSEVETVAAGVLE